MPLILLPKNAPSPFAIIMNNPWALALLAGGDWVSIYRELDMLKKSKAIP